jgi:hypothetical protein
LLADFLRRQASEAQQTDKPEDESAPIGTTPTEGETKS